MTNKEILQKCFNKAIKNGLKATEENSLPNDSWYLDQYINLLQYKVLIFDHDFAKAFFGEKQIDRPWKWVIITDKDTKFSIGYFTVKEFAKNYHEIYKKLILTKNDSVEDEKNFYIKDFDFIEINKGWEYHLQQMVLEKEPLKYLEKFLPESG